MEIIYSNFYEVRFKHSSGGVYVGEIAGCGQALRIFDASDNLMTEIPLSKPGNLRQEDLDVAEIAITAIETTRWLARRRQVEQALTVEYEKVVA